jgi:hypothetical protein
VSIEKQTCADYHVRMAMLTIVAVHSSPNRALNLPVSDYAFDDCKLMEYAQKCKLFFSAKIADVSKFREKIG